MRKAGSQKSIVRREEGSFSFSFRFVRAFVSAAGFVIASPPLLSLLSNPPSMLLLLGVILVFCQSTKNQFDWFALRFLPFSTPTRTISDLA